MSGDRNDNDVLRQLRDINKNRECWRENIDDVAAKLNGDYSVAVKAKSLWILGEMGLNYPAEIEAKIARKINQCDGKDWKSR